MAPRSPTDPRLANAFGGVEKALENLREEIKDFRYEYVLLGRGKKTGELVIVGNDDWWGLYQDGQLIYEGHDSPNNQLFRTVIKTAGVSVDIKYADYDWMCDEMSGHLPEKLSDVKYGKPR